LNRRPAGSRKCPLTKEAEEAMNRRLDRAARNEALIRVVNERIEQVDKAAEEAKLDHKETLFEFLCECGDGDAGDVGCEAHVEMTIREYEAVRSQDDRFALHPGHEQEAIESVVARNKRFVVVDKKPSVERFVEDDPRGAPSE
jgi:hypothetical protein